MRAKANDTEMELVDPGLHKARCIRVIDRGTHQNDYGSFSHQLMIMFELPETQIQDGEAKGQPFSICIFPNLTIGEKSNLRRFLIGWLGRSMTPEEKEEGYDPMQLIDKPAYLNIVHNEEGKKTYANVQSISPLAEKECPPRINNLIKFDLENFDENVFKELSEKMQNYIEESREWTHRFKTELDVEKTFGSQNVNDPEKEEGRKDFFEFMLDVKTEFKKKTGSHELYNSELSIFEVKFLSEVKGNAKKQADIRAYFEALLDDMRKGKI